jgi:hypothetical protein
VTNVSSKGVTAFGDTAVTATAPQTITQKTINSPRVDRLLDTNGAPILSLNPVAAAVDYLQIANGTGAAQVRAVGTSPNIDVNVFGKGSGQIKLRNDGGIGFQVDPVAGSVNFLFARGSATGNAVTLGAAGTDLNTNVNVTPLGTGVIQQRGVQVELKGHTHAVADVMGAESTARKGVADGYASLDSTGRIPAAQLATAAVEYKGGWSAATNTPALANGTGNQGDMWRVTASGTQLGAYFTVGDVVFYDGVNYVKLGGGPSWVAIPPTSSSPGVMGQMAHDGIGGFLYICVATNQWRRTALTTW